MRDRELRAREVQTEVKELGYVCLVRGEKLKFFSLSIVSFLFNWEVKS